MNKKLKEKMTKKKWASHTKRGIYPPTTVEEKKKRLREAHGE